MNWTFRRSKDPQKDHKFIPFRYRFRGLWRREKFVMLSESCNSFGVVVGITLLLGQVWQSRDAVVRLLFWVDTARLPDAACTRTCDSVLSLIGWSLWGVKLRPELCPEDENKHID